ncbi:iron-siderophore ABC transporter substrate-binding protein [Brevibacterium sp. 'Marine']|uniref:ABC transporter substrate-binding protein n=1 Tax=Brevibacterium sp. 'Marine' TaxID=2725563 RepID=UPI00145EC930|nr:iron-siderophore ABC transporter substrate-binding protein [Brevibacterium sp. 'Marine']
MSNSVRFRPIAAGAAVLSILAVLSACEAGGDREKPESGKDTHSVEHARGVSEVIAETDEVVTLEPLELDTAVALGVTPLGAAVASNVTGIPEYLEADGVESVGTVPEPNLEAIAALEPELILGTESRHSKLYDKLEDIAPTVFIASQADSWRDNALLVGDALGRRAEASELLEEVDDRCAAIRDEHDIDGETAQMIRPRDEATLSLYGPSSFAGSLLECVGYTIPDQIWADGLQADISPENAVDARADAVFVTVDDVSDDSGIPEVVAGNSDAFPDVTPVDTSYWVSGVGPKGAHKVLDDIEAYLDAHA